MRSAAAGDPDLARMWDEMQQARLVQLRLYAELARDRDPESAYDDEQIDIVWALAGPELYTALVVERGWSVEQYVAAMGDVVERLRDPQRSLA